MSKILIFTATYNEKENIINLINKINEYSGNADILIIDDNSPDGTGNLLKDFAKENNNLNVIIRDKKLGLDTAHKIAFKYAKENSYSSLITMDADLSHDPSEIPKMISLLKINYFVIGSRYIEGGKSEMTIARQLLSIYGNKLIKFILGIKCNEFTTSYRGFNLDKLKGFHLNLVTTKGYSFFMGTMFVIQKMKFEIKEIPIIFKDREKGISKIPKIEIFRTLTNLIILTFKNKLN